MTSKEFAKVIGVSQSTVSRAMNDSDLVPAEKRAYIQKKAIELGFCLNSQARGLKTNRTGTVGILFPKHFAGMHINLSLAYLYDLVQRELHNYGYDVMVVYDSDNKGTTFPMLERTIRQHKVDGLIVFRMDLSQKELELFRQYNVPCVYLLNADTVDECSSCISDSEYGGYLIGRYLGQFKDYTCYYISVVENLDTKEHQAGYIRGLKEQNVTLHPENILYCNLSVRSAYECIMRNKEQFQNKKCSIFAYNDLTALGVVNACRDLGLQIPEMIQVAGMDCHPLIMDITPKITSIRPFFSEVAKRGCDLLRKSIEDPEKKVVQIVIKPEFVKGETTL